MTMTSDVSDRTETPEPGNTSPARVLHEAGPSPRATTRANNGRILRLPNVCSLTGFGRSMIYQMEAEHRFPRRIKIGDRAVGWIESEVQEWVQQRIESSRGRAED